MAHSEVNQVADVAEMVAPCRGFYALVAKQPSADCIPAKGLHQHRAEDAGKGPKPALNVG